MTELNKNNARDKILHSIQRQIQYLRTKPESRLRVVARLEALYRIVRVSIEVGDTSPYGRLAAKVQEELPRLIGLLKSDPKNDPVVAQALAQLILGASLRIHCARSEVTAETSRRNVEERSNFDKDGIQDEDDLTRVLFGSYL